jgi:hypothetical protein
MQEKVIVSFKKPDPQNITLGINRNAMAICFVKLGYSFVKTTNNFQTPIKESAENNTVVGKYVVKVNNPRNAPNAGTKYSAGLLYHCMSAV